MGRPLRVRYENPQKLDWTQYQIESVRMQDKNFSCGGMRLMIPRAELPEGDGEVFIEVRLVQGDTVTMPADGVVYSGPGEK